MIEKLKQQDDSEFKWIDEEGISHRSKTEYLQENILGFCRCGNSNDVMIYIRDFLIKIESNDWSNYEDLPYMFLTYWADYNSFSEHGVSVRCSWLSNRGKELLSDINWCLENEHEN